MGRIGWVARGRGMFVGLCLLLCGSLAGCGDDTDDAATSVSSEPSSGSADAGSSGATFAGATTDGGGSGGSSGSATSTAGESGTTGSGIEGLDDVGTLVILGDSIGDGGGIAPYYYDLLRDDLAARFGGIEYRNRAEGGSETPALLGQAQGLPGTLPGPVAVVITSGGNDMKDSISEIVLGADGPLRDQMASNIDAALGELLTTDRFGPGVEVAVFEANIYDPSDGIGDYGMHDCNFGQGLPTIPTEMFFANWNGAIEGAVQARGQRYIDMHAHFRGHGYAGDPNWYHTDCTHPNATGHDALRRFLYEQITGEVL